MENPREVYETIKNGDFGLIDQCFLAEGVDLFGGDRRFIDRHDLTAVADVGHLAGIDVKVGTAGGHKKEQGI